MDTENVQSYIAIWIAMDMRLNCLSAPNMFFLTLLVIQVDTSLVFCVMTVSACAINKITIPNSNII